MGVSFAVDAAKCIRCAACSTVAPGLFSLREGDVTLLRQPRTETELLLAEVALLACPASAISTRA